MKKIVLIITVILANQYTVHSQDVHFSQFYENNVLRNPGLIGIQSGDYRVGMNYRNQWSSLSTPFVTALLTAESRFIVNKPVQDYLSIAFSQLNYSAGSTNFTTNSIYFGISYNKSLEDRSRTYLSLGFTGGYTQRTYDIAKMTFGNQFVNGQYSNTNPNREVFSRNNVQSYDLGTGITLNGGIGKRKSGNYYVGLAAYNLLTPTEVYQNNDVFVRKTIRYTANLGLNLPITYNAGISLYANYQNQYPYTETIAGALFSWAAVSNSNNVKGFTLYLGSFYRLNDAIIPTIKINYNRVTFNFSYDHPVGSKFGYRQYGGYEMTLFVRGNYKHKKYQPDPMKCPRFDQMLMNEELSGM